MVMTYDPVCLCGDLGYHLWVGLEVVIEGPGAFGIFHGFGFGLRSFGCYKHTSSGNLSDIENAT